MNKVKTKRTSFLFCDHEFFYKQKKRKKKKGANEGRRNREAAAHV